MKRNITLIPSIVAENHNTYVSNKAQGSGYYKSNNPVHTVSYSIANGFVGKIKMQATLVKEPTEQDWADIAESAVSITNEVPQGMAVTLSKTMRGQFMWVRAVVQDFTAGAIEKISYSYN